MLELRPERHLSHGPLVQVMFQLLSFSEDDLSLNGLEAARLPAPAGRVRFDLEMHLWQAAKTEEHLQGAVDFSTDLFERATIERFVRNFVTLLEGIVAKRGSENQQPVIAADRKRPSMPHSAGAAERKH